MHFEKSKKEENSNKIEEENSNNNDNSNKMNNDSKSKSLRTTFHKIILCSFLKFDNSYKASFFIFISNEIVLHNRTVDH